MDYKVGLLQCIAAFGALYLLKGELSSAITLFSACQALGRNGPTLDKIDRLELEEHAAEARVLASEAVWSSAWTEGQDLSLEEAIALAVRAA